MARNSIAELERLGMPASVQRFAFDCTVRTIQKFRSVSDEAEMTNPIFSKAELLAKSLESENDRETLAPLFSGDPHLLLCLSGILSLGAQYGREETSPASLGEESAPLDEATEAGKSKVLASGLADVLDVLGSEFHAAPDEASAAAAGIMARFDRLAAADPVSNPWAEMASLGGNIFSRMKAMESICKPHYAEIIRDVRMPVYASLCDVLRGPAGRKLYEVLRSLHGSGTEQTAAAGSD